MNSVYIERPIFEKSKTVISLWTTLILPHLPTIPSIRSEPEKKTHNPDFQAQSNPPQLQPPTYKRILQHSKNCARTTFH